MSGAPICLARHRALELAPICKVTSRDIARYCVNEGMRELAPICNITLPTLVIVSLPRSRGLKQYKIPLSLSPSIPQSWSRHHKCTELLGTLNTRLIYDSTFYFVTNH